jgi:hypothetical protein
MAMPPDAPLPLCREASLKPLPALVLGQMGESAAL